MIPKDKTYHLIVGFIITLAVGLFFGNVAAGLLAGVVAGVAKEVKDYLDYGKFDGFDMFATWIGSFLGSAVVVIVL